MELSTVKTSPPGAVIRLTRETAPLLLELLSKSAIAAPEAHLLADLYAQAAAVAAALKQSHEA